MSNEGKIGSTTSPGGLDLAENRVGEASLGQHPPDLARSQGRSASKPKEDVAVQPRSDRETADRWMLLIATLVMTIATGGMAFLGGWRRPDNTAWLDQATCATAVALFGFMTTVFGGALCLLIFRSHSVDPKDLYRFLDRSPKKPAKRRENAQ